MTSLILNSGISRPCVAPAPRDFGRHLELDRVTLLHDERRREPELHAVNLDRVELETAVFRAGRRGRGERDQCQSRRRSQNRQLLSVSKSHECLRFVKDTHTTSKTKYQVVKTRKKRYM